MYACRQRAHSGLSISFFSRACGLILLNLVTMSVVMRLLICVLLFVVVANARYLDNGAYLSRDNVNINMDRVKRESPIRKRENSFESYENLEAQEDVVLRPLFVHRLLNRNRNDQRRRFVNPFFFSGVSENKKLNFDNGPEVQSFCMVFFNIFSFFKYVY